VENKGGFEVEEQFRVLIVWLVLSGKAEEALERLGEHYGVDVPRLRVGLPKGHKAKAFGCYNTKDRTICVLDSDRLREPFVVLHEFYHHLRTAVDAKHRGTEKRANDFARAFIEAYKRWEMMNRNG
jgi:Zn-dependent peptidase ImmA (M78 family)